MGVRLRAIAGPTLFVLVVLSIGALWVLAPDPSTLDRETHPPIESVELHNGKGPEFPADAAENYQDTIRELRPANR